MIFRSGPPSRKSFASPTTPTRPSNSRSREASDFAFMRSAKDRTGRCTITAGSGTGKIVWEMKEPETTHAGGAGKNRKVDFVITLPAGKYKLRYKADDSHSFDNWNSLPPDYNFWGIALYPKED